MGSPRWRVVLEADKLSPLGGQAFMAWMDTAVLQEALMELAISTLVRAVHDTPSDYGRGLRLLNLGRLTEQWRLQGGTVDDHARAEISQELQHRIQLADPAPDQTAGTGRDRRVPEGWFRGTFETAFPAASADGFTFRIRVEGRWRRRLRRQQDPASAAASYATDEVIRLAAACSILAAAALESKANAHLGRPAKLARLGVRMQWARVHVGATLEDQHEAETRMRIRARARSDRDDTRLRIARTPSNSATCCVKTRPSSSPTCCSNPRRQPPRPSARLRKSASR